MLGSPCGCVNVDGIDRLHSSPRPSSDFWRDWDYGRRGVVCIPEVGRVRFGVTGYSLSSHYASLLSIQALSSSSYTFPTGAA